MTLEEPPVRAALGAEPPDGEARHHLAQDREVVLGLALPLGALDAEPAEILAHPRQRTLVAGSR